MSNILGFFNITKTIRHQGEEVNVEIPDKVEDDSKLFLAIFFLKKFPTLKV